MQRHVPLQIPGGWIVYFNNFFDEDPLLADGTDNPGFNDSQDLLWFDKLHLPSLARFVVSTMKHNDKLSDDDAQLTRALWQHDTEETRGCWSVDLGWYGSRRDGTYRLVLLDGSWDRVVATVSSRSKDVIRDTIDLWLRELTANDQLPNGLNEP